VNFTEKFAGMFAYVSNRFLKPILPIEIWDAIGVEKGIAIMKAEGLNQLLG
jgi:hypothetical protein